MHISSKPNDRNGIIRVLRDCHPLYHEMYRIVGTSAVDEVNNILRNGFPYRVVYVNDVPMCYGTLTHASGRLTEGDVGVPAWCLTTALNTHPRHAVAMLRQLGGLFDEMIAMGPKQRRLETFVWTEYPMGYKFAKACRFTIEPDVFYIGDLPVQAAWREE